MGDGQPPCGFPTPRSGKYMGGTMSCRIREARQIFIWCVKNIKVKLMDYCRDDEPAQLSWLCIKQSDRFLSREHSYNRNFVVMSYFQLNFILCSGVNAYNVCKSVMACNKRLATARCHTHKGNRRSPCGKSKAGTKTGVERVRAMGKSVEAHGR